MNKILSIIIPTYNMEKYLRRCLDSLVVSDANMQSLEVLVVNDGSKDSSSQIAHEFAKKHSDTFRIIDKENGNYGSCVNKGLKEATGKYVKVLDADDYFDTSEFEKAINFLKQNDYDLVLTDYNKVDEEGHVEKMFELPIPHNQPLEFKALLGFSARRMHMHRIFYQTDKLRAIGYHQTEGMSYTDQEWMCEPMTTVNRFYYMDICLYQYLVGREGQTVDPAVKLRSIKQYMHAVYVMTEFYEKYNGDADHRKYVWHRLEGQLWEVYRPLLCETRNQDLSALFEFDRRIKELSPEIYRLGNIYKVGKIRIVTLWRKFKYTNSSVYIPFLYGIVLKINKIRFRGEKRF